MVIAAGNLHVADHIVVIGYFVVMLGIGAYFYRFMRRMRDYFTGNARIPWWLSGTSFYMSSFSVFGFVVYSDLAYRYGWLAVTIFWSYIPGTLLCTYVFSKRWRRARIDSPIEYLEARFSPAMRQVCAWHGIPVKIIDDGLKLVAIGIFFSVSLNLDMRQSMLWSGLIMLAYTFMGGLWAVVVTDFVQFVVMGAAVLVLFVLAMLRAGGIGEFVANAPEGTFSLTNVEYGWAYIASMVFLYAVSMSSVHWQLIQRFCCVPDEREGRKMGLLVVALQFVTPIVMFVPAMAARQFLGADLDPRQIYPVLCTHLLPAGMLGLMIAAMFAATMSMLSSDYNALANVVTNDVYRRLFRPQAVQRELLLVGRLVTLLVGLVALGTAFAMVGQGGEDLFRTMVKLFSVATAPVAVPMILGLLSRRMTAAGALVGFFAGLLLGVVLFFVLPDTIVVAERAMKKENLLLVGTAITSAVIMFVISRLWPQSEVEGARTAAFLDRLRIPIGALPHDREGREQAGEAPVAPFRVVGVSIILVGVIMLAVSPLVSGRAAFGMNAGVGAMLIAGGAIMIRATRAKGDLLLTAQVAKDGVGS
jgi:SSS family transporter